MDPHWQQPQQQQQPQAQGPQPAAYPQPQYGQPYGPPSSQPAPVAEDPGKILAIVGLIVGFVVWSPVGLVLCIIANKKSKQSGHDNTLAKIGIWVHGILTALGVLAIIGLLIAFAVRGSH